MDAVSIFYTVHNHTRDTGIGSTTQTPDQKNMAHTQIQTHTHVNTDIYFLDISFAIKRGGQFA